VSPTATIPRNLDVHAVEQVLRQNSTELDDGLLDQLAQTFREAFDSRNRRRFVRVELVHLADAARRRARTLRRIVVDAIDVTAQREDVEDAAPARASLTQHGVTDVLRHAVGAHAVRRNALAFALDEQCVSLQDGQAGLQVVRRHVRQVARVDEVRHRARVTWIFEM